VTTNAISEAEFFEFEQAIKDLNEFVGRVSQFDPPHYHSFLRTLVNSVQPMLGVAMLLSAGGNFEARCNVFGATFSFAMPDPEIQGHFVALTHRAFYSTYAMTIEAMCEGFCHARGAKIISTRNSQTPQFADYLNSALAQSKLDEARKTYWRTYFYAARILRNKSAHFASSFVEHEKKALVRAGLDHHIGDNGHMQTRPANYLQMVNNAHDFIKEIESVMPLNQ
jgi:hypothetical protein